MTIFQNTAPRSHRCVSYIDLKILSQPLRSARDLSGRMLFLGHHHPPSPGALASGPPRIPGAAASVAFVKAADAALGF